ncbi:MAG TPA: PRC-barrel domain-containing protein [Candidatus Nanoarchaeia archaeon]|nr:PRC-barrel domain-containing protein [Candidatus Nanoarchaeia archaeon]
MLRIHKLNEVLNKHVYTSEGDYFGQIEEVNLVDNKIDGWKIKVGGSFLNVLGGAKGVIIPHQFVKSIGDIFIVNKGSLPVGGMPVEDASANGPSAMPASDKPVF